MRRPSLPLLARLDELISSLALPLWEAAPALIVPRPSRDFYDDSHEKWRVFGGFAPACLAAHLRPLRRRALKPSYTRTNRYGGITTAHESNTHTMTSYARTTAGRWHSHTSGQQHCLSWRAAAARSDGGLHVRDAPWHRCRASPQHTRSARMHTQPTP